MDWDLAIKLNRDALLRLLTLWIASLERVAPDGAGAMVPRHVRNNFQRLLRPAESALRRLIVAVAKNMKISQSRTSAARSGTSFAELAKKAGQGSRGRIPAFPLFDRRKNFTPRPKRAPGPGPRVIGFWDDSTPLIVRRQMLAAQAAWDAARPKPRLPGDPVSAECLRRRLQSLKRALEDLPRQARRLARWRAKREETGKGHLSPLRPGWPPGHRKRPLHDIDRVLGDCHSLAIHALNPSAPP